MFFTFKFNISVETCPAILQWWILKCSKTSKGTGDKGKHHGVSPARPDRPATACEVKKHTADDQDIIEDGETPGLSSRGQQGDSGDTLHPKKTKTIDGSSLLAANFDTLTSTIHQLMQVVTPPAAVAAPANDSAVRNKGKSIDKTMKKFTTRSQTILKRAMRKTVAHTARVTR